MNIAQAQYMVLDKETLEAIDKMTRSQKEMILKANGWMSWWSEENWIETSVRDTPGVNIDYLGISFDKAVIRCFQQIEYRKEYDKWVTRTL